MICDSVKLQKQMQLNILNLLKFTYLYQIENAMFSQREWKNSKERREYIAKQNRRS